MTDSIKQRRRRSTAEAKLKVIQEARQGGVPVRQVCDQYDIRPSQFYQWERKAEQGALEGLCPQKRGRMRVSLREEQLVAEIERLREVIAELNRANTSGCASGRSLALKRGVWR
jgi:transposase-like protein